jgi:hypothetical protein
MYLLVRGVDFTSFNDFDNDTQETSGTGHRSMTNKTKTQRRKLKI